MSVLDKFSARKVMSALALGSTAITGITASLMAFATPAQAAGGINTCLEQGADKCKILRQVGGDTAGQKGVTTGPWSVYRAAKVAAIKANAEKMFLNDVWDLLEAKTKIANSGITIADLKDADRDRVIVVNTVTGKTYAAIRTTTNVGDLNGDGNIEGDFVYSVHNSAEEAQAALKGANTYFCDGNTVTDSPDVPAKDVAEEEVITTPEPSQSVAPPPVFAAPPEEPVKVAKPATSGLYLAGGIALGGDKSKTGSAISGGVAQGNANITGSLNGTARAIVGRSGTNGKIGLREVAVGPQIRINKALLAGVEVGLLGAGTTPVTTATPFAFNPALAGQSDTSSIANGLGVRPTVGAKIGDNTLVSASFATTSLLGGKDKENFNQFNLSLQRNGRLSIGAVVTPLLNIKNRDDIIGVNSKAKGAAVGVNYDLNGKPNGLDAGMRLFYGDTKVTVAAVPGLSSKTSEFTINPALGFTKGKLRLEVSPSYTFADTKNKTPRGTSNFKNNEARVMFNFSVRLGNAPLPSVSAGYGDTAAKIDAWNDRYAGKGETVRRLSPEQERLAGIDNTSLAMTSGPTGKDFKQPNGLTPRQQAALQNAMDAVKHESAAGCKVDFTTACADTGIELAKVLVQQANAGGDNAAELQSYLEQNPMIQDIGLGKINLAGTMGGVSMLKLAKR